MKYKVKRLAGDSDTNSKHAEQGRREERLEGGQERHRADLDVRCASASRHIRHTVQHDVSHDYLNGRG